MFVQLFLEDRSWRNVREDLQGYIFFRKESVSSRCAAKVLLLALQSHNFMV